MLDFAFFLNGEPPAPPEVQFSIRRYCSMILSSNISFCRFRWLSLSLKFFVSS